MKHLVCPLVDPLGSVNKSWLAAVWAGDNFVYAATTERGPPAPSTRNSVTRSWCSRRPEGRALTLHLLNRVIAMINTVVRFKFNITFSTEIAHVLTFIELVVW